MFHSTDARRACRRGAIGSTMGAYPRDTGSNPVEGNGHFFLSYGQLYLSSFFDTHTHSLILCVPGSSRDGSRSQAGLALVSCIPFDIGHFSGKKKKKQEMVNKL